MTQRAASTNEAPEARPNIQMSCPYLVVSPPPRLHAGPPGASEPRTPGEGALRRDRGAIKSRGGRGMRFLAAQSPCSPGSSSLPRSVPPSCLLIISFYSFLKRWLVFLSHFSFLHNPRLLASLWSPALRAPFSRRQALRIPADSLSAPLRCSPSSALLSPPSFNFTETPV